MSARPDSGRDTRVCVAQIGAAHGLKGEVRLRSFTEDPLAIAQYGPLETEDRARQLEIETLRPAKDHFVVRFRAVADRDAAESLCNVKLYVERDKLPAIDDDTFYHADLVGLSAVTPAGEAFGEVAAMHNFGAGDIIELKLTHGGDNLLLPFSETVVPQIDIAGGRIMVVLPEETVADEPAPAGKGPP